MRKYVILITFTSIIIAGIVIFGKMIQATGMEVTVYKIKPRPVKQTVSCSGRVEAAESEDVYVKIPCVVGEIYVSPGDEVSEGDVLFSVDVDATKEVIAAAAGILPSMVTEEQISKDVITPVSGNVRSVNVVKGGAINTETPCAVISSSDALQVKVSIQESRLRNIKVGQTTADNLFTLEATRCLGCCGLAPVMMIDDDVYGKMEPQKIKEILKKYK